MARALASLRLVRMTRTPLCAKFANESGNQVPFAARSHPRPCGREAPELSSNSSLQPDIVLTGGGSLRTMSRIRWTTATERHDRHDYHRYCHGSEVASGGGSCPVGKGPPRYVIALVRRKDHEKRKDSPAPRCSGGGALRRTRAEPTPTCPGPSTRLGGDSTPFSCWVSMGIENVTLLGIENVTLGRLPRRESVAIGAGQFTGSRAALVARAPPSTEAWVIRSVPPEPSFFRRERGVHASRFPPRLQPPAGSREALRVELPSPGSRPVYPGAIRVFSHRCV